MRLFLLGVPILMAALLASEAAAAPRLRPLLGVIRWDMYSGDRDITQKQEFGFLAPEEFQWRAPFFVRRTGNPRQPLAFNPNCSPDVLQVAMDQEIRFTASSGIDYWAFGHERKDRNWGLRYNLEAYLRSPLKREVGFCVIANCGAVGNRKRWEPPDTVYDPADVFHEWTGYVAEYLDLMHEPSYQRVLDGRPLIYLYSPEALAKRLRDTGPGYPALAKCVAYLRDAAKTAGLGNPYVVCMMGGAEHRELLKAGVADAVTLYHYRFGPSGQDHPYATLWPAIRDRVLGKQFGDPDVSVVPPLMSGANWIPRVRVMPQVFPNWNWLEPGPGELGAHLRAGLDWVAEHPAKCPANTVLMYAWNEHSEGGFLCPLMGAPPNYEPVTRQIDEVSRTLANWTPPGTRATDGEVLASFTFGDREPTVQSVAEVAGCAVSALRLPKWAYLDPVTDDLQRRRGYSLAVHLLPEGVPSSVEFTLHPAKPGTRVELTGLSCALWRQAPGPGQRLRLVAEQAGKRTEGTLEFGVATTAGWQEATARFPAGWPGTAGDVTVRLALGASSEPVLIRLDDLRLTGRVVQP